MYNTVTDIIQNLKNKFPFFGINKIRELSRLVFEISKRENIGFEFIINGIDDSAYERIKVFLLKRRYPKTYGFVPKDSFYLPDMNINYNECADLSSKSFYPKKIYYTKDVVNSALYGRIKTLYANAVFIEIESLKKFLCENKFSVGGYNRRKENLFLTNEKYDFFKPCPCTKNVVCCNYSILNTGYGCLYECSYCFLQGYQNVSGIILPCNISDFLCKEKIKPVKSQLFDLPRVGSGEFTDSLLFDDITLFSTDIVKFFKENKHISFEFKTKSVNIDNLLKLGGSRNIVVSWSVNSEKMIEENEFCSPKLEDRLLAAKKCVQAGYSVGFHFDPVILYSGWRQGYKKTIDNIFDFIDGKYIKWISVGSLRMPAVLKKVIENRFVKNKILDEELLLSHDGKLRYETSRRIEIYKYLLEQIKLRSDKVPVYLCMEDINVWNLSEFKFKK